MKEVMIPYSWPNQKDLRPWSGRLGRIAECCIYCGDKGTSFQISSRGASCTKCDPNSQPIPELEKQFCEQYEKLAREWCTKNWIDYDATLTSDSVVYLKMPVKQLLLKLKSFSNQEDGLDFIYEQLQFCCEQSDWKSLDTILNSEPTNYDTTISLAILVVTSWGTVRQKLKNRNKFFQKVHKHFASLYDKNECDDLLKGLE
jgi:hypothetical protein